MKLKPDFSPAFFRRLFSLGIPIAAQSLLESAVNFLDTLMIGQLGEVSLGAVALGNKVYFIVLLTLFGISSGVGIFVSQFWGKQDKTHIRGVMGIGLLLSLAVTGLAALAALLIPDLLMKVFTNDQRVIDMGRDYLRIAALSYPLTAVSVMFAMGMRSCGETRLPLIATATGLVMNGLFNYLFIFGFGPIPAMGARGAALGTLLARGIQTALMIWFAYSRKAPSAGSIAEFLDWHSGLFKRVMRTALPVIVNEIGWSTGVSLFEAIFARISTEVLAARSISDTIFRILLVVFIGMANAGYIMIGNTIGAGKMDEARTLAANFTFLAPVLGVFTAALLLLQMPLIPLLFNINDSTLTYVRQFLIISALVYPFKALSIVQIVAILRSGGDTMFSLLMDVGGVWLIGLPLAFVSGLILQWPPMLVFFLASSEEIVKVFIALPRTASGKWLNDLTVQK